MFDLVLEADLSALDRIEKRLEKDLAKATAKGALLLERESKKNAPVDTGNLRNSIHAAIYGKSVPGPYVPSTPFEAFLVVGAEYGRPVEFGYFVRRSKERKRTGYGKKGTVRVAVSRVGTREHGTHVVGRFYLTRAIETVRPRFLGFVKEAIEGTP